MGERHTVSLTRANRGKALAGVEIAIAKGLAPDAKPWTLELRERTRTDDQNDALHGLITQILKQRPTLMGVKMDKVRYKAVFMQALGHEVTMLPTLDGTGFFPLGLSTSRLTVGEFAQLMEFILAWCAEQGLHIEHFDGQGAREGQEPSARAA